ncbi:PDR/VanB family oxidoreductase [Nocardioides sp. WS12]|uniref:PDR/VanB family oxidoreductase n=1 Tax=Nocardioides sp. WS12 TaxID=2486272 RepID=UPI0015F83813|nr:PDR/VanB family oxidoreductase [Nocardioides sp. WS12]
MGSTASDPLLHAADLVLRAWTRVGPSEVPATPRAHDAGLDLVVTDRTVVATDQDVVSFQLAAPDGERLPKWRPGAHLDVHLPSGRKRQYSLCGDPTDRTSYRIAVRRIPAQSGGLGGSVEMHDLPVGSTLQVSRPRNAFPLAVPGHGSPAERLHFVAGGIGITPILPMVRLADALDVDWTMVYVGRRRDTLPFLDELAAYGERVVIRTDDTDGLPTAADLLVGVDTGTAVYCCGPVPMIDVLRTGLLDRTDVEFHSERFSAPPVVDGRAFTLELENTGEVFEVPADRSPLDVLAEAYPAIPYSCRQGFCGTCKLTVIEGDADHRDGSLTADERAAGCLLPCVSRAQGDRLVVRADLH